MKSPLPETLVGLAHGDVQIRAPGRGPCHCSEARKDPHQTHWVTALSSQGCNVREKTKAWLSFWENRSGDTCCTDQNKSHIFYSSSLT